MIPASSSFLKLNKVKDGQEIAWRQDRRQLWKLSLQELSSLTFGQASIVAALVLVIVAIPAINNAAASTEAQGRRKLKEQDIIQKVLRGYDWRVRPRGRNESHGDTGGPVLVTVNIYFRSISKIDDVNMEYSAQFTFREEWWDPRLAYGRLTDEETEVPPFVVLATTEHADTSQQIWMPDTFFQNEKEARRHLIDKPNVLIRIYPNGNILYSVRLSLVLSCPMSLENYPLDKQTCLIDMARAVVPNSSYAYTTDDIKYEWKLENPIQQKDGLKQSLPSFELQDVTTDYCTSKTNTGEYSCVRVKLMLRREYSYYLIQLYIPCVMLVVVSWVSFWLDKDAVPARVSLGVTTLLTMTTQASGINSKLPPVSYIKAVDVWIGSCLAFIFSALLEYALVNYYGRREFMSKESSKKRVSNYGLLPTNTFMATTPNDSNANYMSTLPPPPISSEIFTTGFNRHDTPQSPFTQRQQKQSRQHSSVRLDMVGGWDLLSLTPPRRKSTIASVGAGRVKRALIGSKMEISKSVDIISRYMFPALFGAFLAYYYVAYVD